MFFFGHFGRRAHVSRALRLPASETATFDCAFNAPDPLLRRRPAESLRAAHRWLGFGVRQFPIYLWHGKSFAPRRLGRLTSRSSRRRVVASLKLVGMRAILAPIRRVRRGLTPALGGSNPYAVHSDRLARCSGYSHAVAVFNCCACSVRQSCNASDSSSGALKVHRRCVRPLRKQWLVRPVFRD